LSVAAPLVGLPMVNELVEAILPFPGPEVKVLLQILEDRPRGAIWISEALQAGR
jgi:hypothetical protein